MPLKKIGEYKMSDDIVSKNGEVVGQWNGESVDDLKKIL